MTEDNNEWLYLHYPIKLKDVVRDNRTFNLTIVTLVLPLWLNFKTGTSTGTSLITASADLYGPTILSYVGIQLRHGININIRYFKQFGKCGQRVTLMARSLALLLFLNHKFVIFQKNTQYFNTHYNTV
jgi:hypothetical protein